MAVTAALIIDCTSPSYGGIKWLNDLEIESWINFNIEKESYNHNVVYTYCEVDIPDILIPKLVKTFAGHTRAWPPKGEKLDGIHEWWNPEPDMESIAYGGYGVTEWPKSIPELRDATLRLRLRKLVAEWGFEFFDLLEQEEIPTKFETMRLPPAIYIYYQPANNLASNFVIIGDGIHKADPLRGQGVLKAAVDAITLGARLSRCAAPRLPKNFATSFFKSQVKRTGRLWATRKSMDYAYGTTIPSEREDLPKGELGRNFGRYVRRLAVTDSSVVKVIFDIFAHVDSPMFLFAPRILFAIFGLWAKELLGYDPGI
ncbi:hypothetical protein M422DRAFT_245043 [Sphaerobolus stellatus SS14]|nr:hypothetical protein M422DRAFT_245043 [Sphaerobolus stellatus SS14]